MAEDQVAPATDTEASAESAFADAAEAVPIAASLEPVEAEPAPAEPVVAAPVAKTRKPRTVKAPKAAPAAPAVPAAKVRKTRTAKPAVAARTVPAKAAVSKAVAAKPVRAATAKPKPAIKPAVRKNAAPAAPIVSQAKESKMEKTTKITDGIKTVVTEAQDKAKAVYAKGSEMLGEYGEFTKGNVEAMVESTKILATGLQGMGTTLVADTKDSFETMTADVKAIAAVKSPTELVKLQGEIARRNLDKAVAYGSKNSEAMLKLANDVFAPISGRFSLALTKLRAAA